MEEPSQEGDGDCAQPRHFEVEHQDKRTKVCSARIPRNSLGNILSIRVITEHKNRRRKLSMNHGSKTLIDKTSLREEIKYISKYFQVMTSFGEKGRWTTDIRVNKVERWLRHCLAMSIS